MTEARQLGLDRTRNGDLIAAAEMDGFDLLVTSDKQMKYQQNLSKRRIAIVVLMHQHWPMVRLVAEDVVSAVEASGPGGYIEVEVPFRKTRRPRRPV